MKETLGYKEYRTKVADSNGKLVENPTPSNTCYKFTWIGIGKEGGDDSRSCSDFTPEFICNEPLVATNGSFSTPDLGELVDYCNTVPSNGTEPACDIYCDKDIGDVCVKFSRFTPTGDLDYYSSFCGAGVDKGWDSRPITNGCHKQNDLTTESGIYDIEVCFCEENNCNGAQSVRYASVLAMTVILFLFL